MANPSLQIGNGKWAIKEDNLLGYSTAGTRFVPQPITMTRATLGTRVNPSGLVEDVALLGSENVTCGDFSCADPNAVWTKNPNWTIANNLATSDGSQTGNVSLKQSNTLNNLTTGTTYKVQFTISGYVAGVINPHIRGAQSGNVTGDGIKTSYITAGSGSDGINLYAGSTFEGSVSNVSVKEATIDNLPRVDYTDGTSSLLVEPMRTNLVTESSDFTNWTTTGSAAVTPNTTISPDGTQNADTLNIFSGNFFYKPITSGAGTFTLSCYVKVASGTLDFKMQSFNGTDGADASSTFTANTNWQRFEFTTTVTTDSNFYPIQVSGLTGGDFQIWGAQVEEGSYATSYIPTDGGTVTRVQETYEKTGISDKINSTEGVLFVEMARSEEENSYRLLGLDNGTSQNYIKIGFGNNNGNFWIRALVNGVTVINSDNAVSNNANQFYKIAVRYKSGDSVIYIDGVPVLTSSTTFSSGTFTDLDFTHFTGSSHFFGKVKKLQIFKTALTDSELATLTT